MWIEFAKTCDLVTYKIPLLILFRVSKYWLETLETFKFFTYLKALIESLKSEEVEISARKLF